MSEPSDPLRRIEVIAIVVMAIASVVIAIAALA